MSGFELRESGGAPAVRPGRATRDARARRRGRRLLCAACDAPVTSQDAAIEVQGAHAHTFTNPHGYVFDVLCFSEAPGCRARGGATTEFTWFAGYAWQVATCASCAEHLGWRYSVRGRAAFYGLIRQRLRAEEGG